MTLPRSKLAEGIAACRQIGDAATTIWGDLGVGSIHVTPLPDARRYATLKAQLATLGAQPCYEFGPPPQPPYPTLTLASTRRLAIVSLPSNRWLVTVT